MVIVLWGRRVTKVDSVVVEAAAVDRGVVNGCVVNGCVVRAAEGGKDNGGGPERGVVSGITMDTSGGVERDAAPAVTRGVSNEDGGVARGGVTVDKGVARDMVTAGGLAEAGMILATGLEWEMDNGAITVGVALGVASLEVEVDWAAIGTAEDDGSRADAGTEVLGVASTGAAGVAS